ncbi:MAG: competence protein TfoX [Rhizobiales bacterium PAR1]|nr:MAG: competence protein TfoX [Rhizobiales bacterium PAR1]
MDSADITEFFSPVVPVSARRMFGGHGIYSDGAIFALEIEGVLYLKVDDENRAFFAALGSSPFTYEKKTGGQAVMAYFSMPEEAYDDEDLLRSCVREALGASRRAEIAKAAKPAKAKAAPKSKALAKSKTKPA